MPNLEFSLADVQPARDSLMLAEGDYKIQIISSDLKNSKANTSKCVYLEVLILDGELRGRTCNFTILVEHFGSLPNNRIAERIGREKIKALEAACGITNAVATEQFHNIPIICCIRQGKESPEIRTFKKIEKQNETVRTIIPFDSDEIPF